MNVTPQSPIFNFNERLSLNDKMAEGDDTSLDDIKLSDFDLDFDLIFLMELDFDLIFYAFGFGLQFDILIGFGF